MHEYSKDEEIVDLLKWIIEYPKKWENMLEPLFETETDHDMIINSCDTLCTLKMYNTAFVCAAFNKENSVIERVIRKTFLQSILKSIEAKGIHETAMELLMSLREEVYRKKEELE